MTSVLIHPLAGALSAYGIGLADVIAMREAAVEAPLTAALAASLRDEAFAPLEQAARADLAAQGASTAAPAGIQLTRRAHLRYGGTDTPLQVPYGSAAEMREAFERAYRARFSFLMEDKPIVVEAISVEAAGHSPPPPRTARTPQVWRRAGARTQRPGARSSDVPMFTAGEWATVPLYRRAALAPGQQVEGPAIIAEDLATTVVEPGWRAAVTAGRDLLLTRVAPASPATRAGTGADPVLLEVFSNLFMAIAEQMGERLGRPRTRSTSRSAWTSPARSSTPRAA